MLGIWKHDIGTTVLTSKASRGSSETPTPPLRAPHHPRCRRWLQASQGHPAARPQCGHRRSASLRAFGSNLNLFDSELHGRKMQGLQHPPILYHVPDFWGLVNHLQPGWLTTRPMAPLLHTYTYTYVHIYVCIYTYIYIYIHLFTYLHNRKNFYTDICTYVSIGYPNEG